MYLLRNVQEENAVTRQEFAELLEEEGRALYVFCCHLTGNKNDADDLYQETMLTAMEKCSRIDRRGNPRSLLMGIAAGSWKNQKRKYARRQRIAPLESMDDEWNFPDIPDTGVSLEEAYISEEMCRLVKMEIDALKEKYRLPVYMYYSAEMSIEEISAALHIPKGTVKSRLHAARTIIKRKMEDYGYEN